MHEYTEELVAARNAAVCAMHERFPEFDGVEPLISMRRAHTPQAADAQRLGIADIVTRPLAAEYTFTFAREIHTAEGDIIPRVARVVVDEQQHVIKAVVSK